MVSGGNAGNRDHRQKRLKEIMDDGRCGCCPPHRGENFGAHKHPDFYKIVWHEYPGKLEFIKSKGKDRK